jgi:hypothetical protein
LRTVDLSALVTTLPPLERLDAPLLTEPPASRSALMLKKKKKKKKKKTVNKPSIADTRNN